MQRPSEGLGSVARGAADDGSRQATDVRTMHAAVTTRCERADMPGLAQAVGEGLGR